MQVSGYVGPSANGNGTTPPFRLGASAESIVQELHGRFYETNYRGGLFSFGISNTALVAANAIATGSGASAQPIIGLYNPTTSGVNMVILQAAVVTTTVANTAVAPGGFMWVGSAGNTAVSTGSTPFNCKSLVAAGSSGKAFACSTALTGLTTPLVVIRASGIASINAAGPATAISQALSNTVENIDGSLIVPPGGVLCLMNQLSTTTISVSAGIMWEEVAV